MVKWLSLTKQEPIGWVLLSNSQLAQSTRQYPLGIRKPKIRNLRMAGGVEGGEEKRLVDLQRSSQISSPQVIRKKWKHNPRHSFETHHASFQASRMAITGLLGGASRTMENGEGGEKPKDVICVFALCFSVSLLCFSLVMLFRKLLQ